MEDEIITIIDLDPTASITCDKSQCLVIPKYICKKHGDISDAGLVLFLQTRKGYLNFCVLCLVELLKEKIGELEVIA